MIEVTAARVIVLRPRGVTGAVMRSSTHHVVDQHAIEAWRADAALAARRPAGIMVRVRGLNSISRRLPRGLLNATEADLDAFQRRIALEGLSPATRVSYVSAIRMFFKWANHTGRRADNPSHVLVTPRVPRRLPRPYDEADAIRRIACLPPSRGRLAVLIALGAGLRCMEIAALRRDDLIRQPDGAALDVRDGKGGQERVVPIPAWLATEIRLHGGRPWVIGRERGDGPLTPSGLSTLGRHTLEAAGVGTSMHRLRHTYATSVYRRSRDLRMTQDLLGHHSPATTARYTAWATGSARRYVEDLPAPYVHLSIVQNG